MAVVTSANKSSPPAPSTPWGLVLLLGALTGMGPLAIDMYLPSLPAIGADLHATSAETQGTVAAFLAGMGIGMLFYGPASDRLGRRPPLLIGVVIFVAASVVCAFATSPAVLLAGRFVQALGACAGTAVARAVVRDRFSHTETARMLSLMTLIMGLAPIFAPLLGGLLLTVGSWRLNFWFMAAFGAAVGVATLLRLKESRSEATAIQASQEHPFQSFAALLRQPRLVGYGLAAALNGATIFAYIASSPDLLIGTYGIAPGAFGLFFGFNAFGVIGANQVNRMLLRRMTPDQVLARSSLIALGFAVALVLAAVTGVGERWSVLPLLFMVLASYGLVQGNTMAGALSVDRLRVGSTSALLGATGSGGSALASALAGAVYDGTPGPMAIIMLATLTGSALSLHSLALPKRP